MRNMVILQKTENGNIYCKQITEAGKKEHFSKTYDPGFWEDGGTIVLDELEEILDREV